VVLDRGIGGGAGLGTPRDGPFPVAIHGSQVALVT
jgi:hypothetical protein